MIIRPARPEDLPRIAEIFGHYVRNTCATFEMAVPSVDAWAGKLALTTDRGWPFLVTADDDEIVGFSYCSAWRSQPAYVHTAEESIYLAPGRPDVASGDHC